MNLTRILTPDLIALRAAFVAADRDIRLVGGIVRDLIMGVDPKDIDLCTNATPDEMIAIAETAGVIVHPTGIDHGTMTFVLADRAVYEITTLRTESDHDGRWATVSFTSDWIADLSRRDLTINAMMLTFEGTLIDPFGGENDIRDRRVRFVGSPEARMQEDYLRILRWLRFHGRITPDTPLDAETAEAVRKNAHGLAGISRERVWMEVSKIISGKGAPALLAAMHDLGIAKHIDLPAGDVERLARVADYTSCPLTRMVAFIGDGGAGVFHVGTLAKNWKWSREETDISHMLAFHSRYTRATLKYLLAVEKVPRSFLGQLPLLHENVEDFSFVMQWQIPEFPVRGVDLLERGEKPGKAMGEKLRAMKERWIESDYTLTKEDLLF